MNEKELQNLVLDYLKAKKIFCWPNSAVTTYDPTRGTFRRKGKHNINGIPDILGILPDGRFLGIELKAPPKGKRKPETLFNMLSEDQKNFQENAILSGGVCFHADSLEMVIEKLSLEASSDQYSTTSHEKQAKS